MGYNHSAVYSFLHSHSNREYRIEHCYPPTWKKILEEKVQQLSNSVSHLKFGADSRKWKLRHRPDIPTLFNGIYHYKRDNVDELSQLISQYLDNKPENIDGNRIFNCLRVCYMDLEKGYSDHPEYYYHNMRMLLATCLASTWLTDIQFKNIKRWHDSYFSYCLPKVKILPDWKWFWFRGSVMLLAPGLLSNSAQIHTLIAALPIAALITTLPPSQPC